LVTERTGQLRIIRKGVLDPEPIGGTPKVASRRYDGLMDVVLHPKFAENNYIYLTYTKANDAGASAIALARGRFDGHALQGVQELLATEWTTGMLTMGSRIAFGPDGTLYMTTASVSGDRSQKLDSLHGKVLRVRDDGTVPPDNPFVKTPGARPEIFTVGHRNA